MKCSRFFFFALLWTFLFIGSACAARSDSKDLGAAAANKGEFKVAYSYWLPLAENGDAEVQEAIALLLISGEDVGVDMAPKQREKMAAAWMMSSAKGGHKSAMMWLSQAFDNGWMGFPRKPELAKCWEDASEGKSDPNKCKIEW